MSNDNDKISPKTEETTEDECDVVSQPALITDDHENDSDINQNKQETDIISPNKQGLAEEAEGHDNCLNEEVEFNEKPIISPHNIEIDEKGITDQNENEAKSEHLSPDIEAVNDELGSDEIGSDEIKTNVEKNMNDNNAFEEEDFNNKESARSMGNTQIYQFTTDPEEINASFEAFMKFQMMPPVEHRNSVIQLINRKKIEYLEFSDYRNVEKLDKALITLKKRSEMVTLKQSKKEKMGSYNDRINCLKNKIIEINDRYDAKIRSTKRKYEKSCKELSDKQETETNSFIEKWRNPNQIRQFEKPSRELMSMRSLEKKMALSQRYDDARILKTKADHVQSIEQTVMQKQMEELMEADFLRLRTFQQNECQILTDKNDEALCELENQREKEIAAVKAAINQVEIKKKYESKKKMMFYPKRGALQIQQQLQQNANYVPPRTPQTTSRMIRLRNENPTDFFITPISDFHFSKLVKSAKMSQKRKRLQPTISSKTLP